MTMSNAVDQTQILMYTSTWCGDSRPAKCVFVSFTMAFVEVTVEEDEQAAAFVLRLNRGLLSAPTIRFPDGSWLVAPSAPTLEAKPRMVSEHAS
jgi:mycoredoxin